MTSPTPDELLMMLTGLRPDLAVASQEMTIRLYTQDGDGLPQQFKNQDKLHRLLNTLGIFVRRLNDRDTEETYGPPASQIVQMFVMQGRTFFLGIDFGHDVGQFLAEAVALTLSAAFHELLDVGISDALMLGALATAAALIKQADS